MSGDLDIYPCPFCGANASLGGGCPGCGRGPDHDAAEVIRLNAELARLGTRLEAARAEVRSVEAQVQAVRGRRDALASRVLAAVSATVVPPPPPPPPPVDLRRLPPASEPRLTTLTAQNVLFALGGLLLVVAAAVFTAVAWAQVGVVGRAAILAAATAAVLAVPPFAVRRGLTGAAETLAAVGLLMILLDGYAAWAVDLFGVTALRPEAYSALVAAVTAGVAFGYGRVVGLPGPKIFALVIAQPVFPLLAEAVHADATGWSLAMTGTAVVNLLALHRVRFGVTPIGMIAYICGFVAALVAALSALAGTAFSGTPGEAAAAGGALVLIAAVTAVGSVLAGDRLAQAWSAGAVTVAVSFTAGAWLLQLSPGTVVLRLAAVALVVAAAAQAVRTSARPDQPTLAPTSPAAPPTPSAAQSSPSERSSPAAEPSPLSDGAASNGDRPESWIARVFRGRLPESVAQGPWIAAMLVAAVPALGVGANVIVAAMSSLSAAQPALGAPLTATVGDLGWGTTAGAAPSWDMLLAAVAVLLTYAVLLPKWIRNDLALVTVAALVLLTPAAFTLRWWIAPILGTVLATLALATVVFRALLPGGPAPSTAPVSTAPPGATPDGTAAPGAAPDGTGPIRLDSVEQRASVSRAVRLTISAVAAVHALATGLGDPGVAAGVLTALFVVGVGTAIFLRRDTPEGNNLLGESVMTIGLLSVAPAVWLALVAAEISVTVQVRALFAVTALLCLAARRIRGYETQASAVALLLAAGTPLWTFSGDDPPQLYVGAALILVATLRTVPPAPIAASVLVVGLFVWTAQDLAALVTFAEPNTPPVSWATVAAVLMSAVAAWLFASVWACAPLVAVAIPLALAAAHTPWPSVPLSQVVAGLTGLVAIVLTTRLADLAPTARPPLTGAAGQSVLPAAFGLLAVTGIAGTSMRPGPLLTAFALVAVAGVIVGAAARDLTSRIAGWVAACSSLLVVAYLGSHDLTHLDSGGVALTLLAAGAIAMVLEWFLATRRPREAPPVTAVAQTAAVIALLISGSAGRAALIATLWAAVLAIRALRPDESMKVRFRYAIGAAGCALLGWWLFLSARDVGTAELYTAPAAALAVLAGWQARRSRPELPSWTAYGPALAAAFLPTLAVISNSGTDEPEYLRRLLLGLAGLAVLIVGALARLQAPTVSGAIVVIITALHELAQVWDLVPRWVPLAIGGLLLVAIATTLEQRRRDLTRLRDAVGRMS